MPKIRKLNASKQYQNVIIFSPLKKIYVYKKCFFFFGKKYLKKLFSDIQKNMPNISKYILGVQCSLTKVNGRLRLKEGLMAV